MSNVKVSFHTTTPSSILPKTKKQRKQQHEREQNIVKPWRTTRNRSKQKDGNPRRIAHISSSNRTQLSVTYRLKWAPDDHALNQSHAHITDSRTQRYCKYPYKLVVSIEIFATFGEENFWQANKCKNDRKSNQFTTSNLVNISLHNNSPTWHTLNSPFVNFPGSQSASHSFSTSFTWHAIHMEPSLPTADTKNILLSMWLCYRHRPFFWLSLLRVSVRHCWLICLLKQFLSVLCILMWNVKWKIKRLPDWNSILLT